MLTSLRLVATYRPGLYLLTAMTVAAAIGCRTPLAIASSITALLILSCFVAFPGAVVRGASRTVVVPPQVENGTP